MVMGFKHSFSLQVPAHCIRGSVSAALTGAQSCISTHFVCVCCMCIAEPVTFSTAIFWQSWATRQELWEKHRVVGSVDVQWWLWPTDPVIHKHQLHSVSFGLSVVTLLSELQPVTSDHCKAKRRGTNFIWEIDPLSCTEEGVPTTNEGRLASLEQLTVFRPGVFSHFTGLIISPVCDC